eukprot:9470226-Pyramimonas_sp.AAC.1
MNRLLTVRAAPPCALQTAERGAPEQSRAVPDAADQGARVARARGPGAGHRQRPGLAGGPSQGQTSAADLARPGVGGARGGAQVGHEPRRGHLAPAVGRLQVRQALHPAAQGR